MTQSTSGDDAARSRVTRRALIAAAAGSITSLAVRQTLAARAQDEQQVTPGMVRQAAWLHGVELDEDAEQSAARSLNATLKSFATMRETELPNHVAPAVQFTTRPFRRASAPPIRDARPIDRAPPSLTDSSEALAFLPVTELSALLRTRRVTSLELTELYLRRLRRFDPLLKCVVSYTDELARRQAAQADREIAAGLYRGPLHGVPWGAKDLISVPGYKTTWGAAPYREQELDTLATVASRLEAAGAVLVAKLSLGALAMGDVWFGGRTRNPWNPDQGSSGSSAGSASAVAGGLVGFALGSETLGSIVSPCRRCGATGLRPTFGRVSRYGCMALAWSMDKIGPITRSAEDTALVLDAIHGYDGLDATAVDAPFQWPPRRELSELRVGYIPAADESRPRPEIDVLKEMGVQLKPIELPRKFPSRELVLMLDVEAGAAFDSLTRQGVTDGLNAWPRIFRAAQFTPAIEYLRASRLRTLLMEEMEAVFQDVDLYVGGNDLVITNFTGHPTVVMPSGFVERRGVRSPRSITMTGALFGESDLISVARAYQQRTTHHLQRPPLEEWLVRRRRQPSPDDRPPTPVRTASS